MASQLQFDVFANDRASDDFHRIGDEVARLARELRALDRMRVDVEVEVDIDDGAGITALAAQLAALTDARIRVDVDIVGDAEIATLATRLGALTDARVRIDVDVDDAGVVGLAAALAGLGDRTLRIDLDIGDTAQIGDLVAELAALEAGSPYSIKVDLDGAAAALTAIAAVQAALEDLDGTVASADVDIDGLAQALAEIEALRAALEDVDGSSANASASVNGLTGALQKAGGAAMAALVGFGAMFGGPLLVVGAGQVASLAGSLVEAAGVLGLIPAIGAAAAASIATLVIGFQGFGEAMENLGDAEKFAEAIAELAPAARDTAVAIRDLGPAWESVQLDVQQALFAGMADELQTLSAAVLPTVREGLVGIATGLNTGAQAMTEFAAQGQTIRDLDTIFLNTRTALEQLAPAGVNVAAAFLDIAQVGSFMLPELAAGLTAATGRFREFIAEARASGALEDFLRGAVENVEQLLAVLGNVGGVLVGVFTAANLAGFDFLGTLVELTGEVEAFVNSVQGQTALVSMFVEAKASIDALLPGLRELAVAAAEFIAGFADSGGVQRMAETFSAAAASLAPLIGQLGQLAGDTLSILATAAGDVVAALDPVVGAVTAVAGAMSGVIPVVAAGAVAWLAFAAAGRGIIAIAPQIAGLVASIAAGFTGLWTAASLGAGALAAITALGKALPVVGIAIVGLSFAFDALTTSADEAAEAVASGQQTMAQAMTEATAEADKQSAALGRFAEVQRQADTPVDELTAAIAAQEAAMTPLELAQSRAKTALDAWNAAIKEHGPNSAEAAAAAAALAAATDQVEAAESAAAAATRDANDALRDQVAAAQSALGAQIALEDALARVGEAQAAANTAAAEHGAASTEAAAANRDLVSAIDQAAQAAGRKAQADAEARGATNAADIAAQAYAQSLLSQAATLEGPARAAVLGYLATLSQVQLDALSAAAAASGFATEVINLPDGKTVTIAVDPETGKIIDVQTLLDNLEDKTVVINGNVLPLEQALRAVLEAVQAGDATIEINGNVVPVQQALDQVIAMIDNLGDVTILINGEAANAQQVLTDLLAAINAGEATVMINGDPVPVEQVLAELLSQVYKIALSADLETTEAQAELDAWVAQQDGALVVPIGFGFDEAQPQLDNFRAQASAPIPINADPAPFLGAVDAALAAALAAAAAAAATVPIDADPTPFAAALADLLAQVPPALTIPVDADTGPFTAAVQAALAAAQAAAAAVTALIPVEADLTPFQADLDAAVITAASLTATMQVDADITAALAALAALVAAGNAANTEATHTHLIDAALAAIAAVVAAGMAAATTAVHTHQVDGALADIGRVIAAGNAADTTATHTQLIDGALAAIARVVAAGNAAATRAAHTQTDNIAAVLGRIRALNSANTTSTHTIRVVEVGGGGLRTSGSRAAAGGAVPRAAGGAVPRFAGGGVISAPPPDDDSFESNSYYSANRGRAGAIQVEDGSWVMPDFFSRVSHPQHLRAEDGNRVPPGFYSRNSTGTRGGGAAGVGVYRGSIGMSFGAAGGAVLRMARGGVLPGYAPNQDRIPALLSPGEAVLVPELTRMLGADTILALNRMASGGRRPTVYGGDGAAAPTFGLRPTSPSSGPVSSRLRSRAAAGGAGGGGGEVHHHYHLTVVNAGGRDIDLIRQFDRLEQLSGGAGG